MIPQHSKSAVSEHGVLHLGLVLFGGITYTMLRSWTAGRQSECSGYAFIRSDGFAHLKRSHQQWIWALWLLSAWGFSYRGICGAGWSHPPWKSTYGHCSPKVQLFEGSSLLCYLFACHYLSYVVSYWQEVHAFQIAWLISWGFFSKLKVFAILKIFFKPQSQYSPLHHHRCNSNTDNNKSDASNRASSTKQLRCLKI